MTFRSSLLALTVPVAVIVLAAGVASAAKPVRPDSPGAALTTAGTGADAPAPGAGSPVLRPKAARPVAQPDDGGGVPPANDTCAGAFPIACGTFSFDGFTNDAINDYTFADSLLSCTGYREEGRDVVYSVSAQAGDSLWLNLWSTADAAVYIITDCNDVQGTCVAGVDLAQAGETEMLGYTFPVAGTYYVIVDSYGHNTGGQYTLVGQFISCGIFPPVNDRCETATELFCGTFSHSGSTANAFNDYSFADLPGSCANSLAGGRDIAYRLNVDAGDSLSVSYVSSADAVIYILGDCGDPAANCTAGVNATGAGQVETLRYRFEFTGTYYLILDSNGADDFGTYSVSGHLVCATPPPVNDRCEGATSIYCGPIYLEGSTALAFNDYFMPDSTSCTGFAPNGPDVAYRLNVSAGDSLWVDYRSTADASIYIVTRCDSLDVSCVIGVDESVANETEYLRYVFPSQGTYYLILDSYDAGIPGDWTLIGELICPPILGVENPSSALAFRLGEFRPNPSAGTSSVRFTLPGRGPAALRIYDLAGRQVRTLVEGTLAAGEHTAVWDARDDQGHRVKAGVYFARLSSEGRTALRKMLLVN